MRLEETELGIRLYISPLRIYAEFLAGGIIVRDTLSESLVHVFKGVMDFHEWIINHLSEEEKEQVISLVHEWMVKKDTHPKAPEPPIKLVHSTKHVEVKDSKELKRKEHNERVLNMYRLGKK